MILIYLILIYTLLGSIVKLLAQNEDIKRLTYNRMLFYYISNIIFMPIINLIRILDNILPTIRQKRAIKYINKQYNKQLKNKDLTDEEIQNIIHKRDTMITFLSNVTKSEPEEDEE